MNSRELLFLIISMALFYLVLSEIVGDRYITQFVNVIMGG
uniref:Glycine rich protein family n=1 Tax=Tectiviridae sp. cthzn51 TaxID=2826821 RepID=A0A8S5LUC7_9VIRU|nr:MAG TPA: Glycine rich protein family [Tectiviridae sp. cthzn51]